MTCIGPAELRSRPPRDDVVQVLVGEAYELHDRPAQHVMQDLSVFPAPVSAVGVDFLLCPVDPTTDEAPILTRLVRRQMVRFQNARYYLHPLDREYARAQLAVGQPGDSLTAFTLTGLQARAADYYVQIRTPRRDWHSLEDVRPRWPSSSCAATRVTTTPPPPCCAISTTIWKNGVTIAPSSGCMDASTGGSPPPP